MSLLTVGLMAAMFAGGSIAYAGQHQSNYDVLCSVANKKVADTGRAQGKRLGTIAKEAGKLSEFQQQVLANKKARLAEKVDAGQITEEQATQVVETIQQNQANCDGTGVGQGTGIGLGNGQGNGTGICDGTGAGNGAGQGAGLGNGAGQGMGQGHRGGGNGLHDGSGAGGQHGRNAGNCVNPQ